MTRSDRQGGSVFDHRGTPRAAPLRGAIGRITAQVLVGAVLVAGPGFPAAAGEGGAVRVLAPAYAYDGPGADRGRLGPAAAGAPVQVTSCLPDFTWCRVVLAGLPGWMDARRLGFDRDGRTATVADEGRALGIPVLAQLPAPPPGTDDLPIAPPAE